MKNFLLVNITAKDMENTILKNNTTSEMNIDNAC
jgi:hypothetical protein